MSKKLLTGIAPLLAVGAFAVMAAAAQAASQHWYKSAVKAAEGEQIPVVMFGGELNPNHAIKPPFPDHEINCNAAGGGMIENPPSGPGIGGMNALAFNKCKAPRKKKLFNQFGVQGRESVEAVNMSASINGHPDPPVADYATAHAVESWVKSGAVDFGPPRLNAA